MKEIVILIGSLISIAYHISIMAMCLALDKIGVMSSDRALLSTLTHIEPIIDRADRLYSLGYFDYTMTMKVRGALIRIIYVLDEICE